MFDIVMIHWCLHYPGMYAIDGTCNLLCIYRNLHIMKLYILYIYTSRAVDLNIEDVYNYIYIHVVWYIYMTCILYI